MQASAVIFLFAETHTIALCLMEFRGRVNQVGEQSLLSQSSLSTPFNLSKSNSSGFLNSSLKRLGMQRSSRYNGLHGDENERLKLKINLKLKDKS